MIYQMDGIVLSLSFAPPSMAPLTADFFLINIHVSEKNKAAQGRYHPPVMVIVLANVDYPGLCYSEWRKGF